ncbi:hypothetical protein [Planctomicrobium piriforme]|nr:hypothetical protein [Planctomicrobium piriforme]
MLSNHSDKRAKLQNSINAVCLRIVGKVQLDRMPECLGERQRASLAQGGQQLVIEYLRTENQILPHNETGAETIAAQ